MKRTRAGMLKCLAIFALLGVGAAPGMADVIFNNFGPADAYITGAGRAVGAVGPTGDINEVATSFTVAGGGFTLDQLTVAVSLLSGQNQLDVSLAASDGAGLPGALLETFRFENAMGPLGSNNPPLVANSTQHPLLSEGAQYWVIASASGATTAVWNFNSTGGEGLTASRTNGGPWSPDDAQPLQAALRVSGTRLAGPEPSPVAEPSALALFAAGALGLYSCGRVRRRRCR